MTATSNRFYQLIVAIFLVASFPCGVVGQSRIPLTDAVKGFNLLANADQTGKSQPPLTVEEVVAAIRLIEIQKPNMAEELKSEFKLIADGNSIDSVDKFRFNNGWGPLEIDGKLHRFNVWWIDLTIERDGIKDRFGRTPITSNLRIRDRTVSSRLLTESEVEEYEKLKLEIKIYEEENRLKALNQKQGK